MMQGIEYFAFSKEALFTSRPALRGDGRQDRIASSFQLLPFFLPFSFELSASSLVPA